MVTGLQQGETEQAQAISRVLASQATPDVQQANLLPFFQGLIAADDHEDIEKFSSQYSLRSFRAEDKAAYLQSLAQYQSSRREPDKAVNTYLQLLTLQPEQTQYQSALWQQLGMLTPDQLEKVRQSSDPTAQGWAQLLQLHQQHLGNTPALTQAISDWQQQYPNLPSLQQLPAEIQQLSAVDAFSPKTIAVLLPFSSNFRQHAEAIQQGILAASANQQARLIFIDSQTDTAALQQQLAAEHGAVGVFTLHTPIEEKTRPYANSLMYLNSPRVRWVNQDGSEANDYPQLQAGAYLHMEAAKPLFDGAKESLDSIFAKLDVLSRTEAIATAGRRGLIDFDVLDRKKS
mgnify:CR=1 FL=1